MTTDERNNSETLATKLVEKMEQTGGIFYIENIHPKEIRWIFDDDRNELVIRIIPEGNIEDYWKGGKK